MTNYSQINQEQRDIIQSLINQNKSFTYIAKVINKDRTSRKLKETDTSKVIFMNLLILKEYLML